MSIQNIIPGARVVIDRVHPQHGGRSGEVVARYPGFTFVALDGSLPTDEAVRIDSRFLHVKRGPSVATSLGR